MIQDIFPHHFDNHYDSLKKPDKNSRILYFSDENLLLCPGIDPFPRQEELPAGKVTYLFTVDSTAYFLANENPSHIPAGALYFPVKKLRFHSRLVQKDIFIAWTALQIVRWMRDNQFCGSCGEKTIPSPLERALLCPHCGRTIYPRLNPAIIAGVTWNDKLLLTRYADHHISFYALIAGFTEIGETLEGTVRREVKEETGLSVKNIRYYKSQPWASASDILAGFFCEVDGNPHITRDPAELSEAFWAEKKDIILQPDDYSLTNEMMRVFKEGQI